MWEDRRTDLAKRQALPDLLLSAPLGGVTTQIPSGPSRTKEETTHETQQRSTAGGSATTIQLKLHPKAQKSSSKPSLENRSEDVELFGSESDLLNSSSLQPADEGFGAWSYVTSAFAMFVIVWGFPEAFPVFQTHLSSGPSSRFPDSKTLPFLAQGLQDILEGLLFQVLPRSASFRRPLVISGIMTITLALFLASCATTAWEIVLTQGVMFGVGGIMLNYVHVSIFSEWFILKKGQAMGIIWLGWRVGSLAFPLICQWLLDTRGYEETLRVLIPPMLALVVPSMVTFRGRYPPTSVQTASVQPRMSNITALRAPNVLFYLLVALLFSSISNVPTMFITRYGRDLQLNSSQQAAALTLRILSSMIGVYVFGRLSDSGYYQHLMIASAISSGLVFFFVWGFAKSSLGLFAYAIAIGLTGGGYDNAMFGIFAEVAGKNGELFTTVHSIFSFFRGAVVLSVGPVGVALLQLSPDVVLDQYAIGKYKYLVFYAGSVAMASGLLALLKLRIFKK